MEAPTPRKKRKTEGCGQHARYTGANPPRSGCPVCWGMYLQQKYDLPIEAVLAPGVVKLNDMRAVEDFIRGLKAAMEKTKKSAGLYSAFVRDRDGRFLQVEIQRRMIAPPTPKRTQIEDEA